MDKKPRQYGPRSRGALRSLGIRCRSGLAFELEQEARANGRSLAMECEMRLEASLRPVPDMTAIIREEIRAALAERDEADEDRCFGPRPEVLTYRY